MNLRQAAYLVAVAEERSFTRAAARLHIAQPSLSQQIKALEDTVGVALVERSARGAALTPAGRAFIDDARAALAAAENAMAKARAVAGMSGGSLHIATVASLASWVLPQVVAAWQPSHPAVTLRITEFLVSRAMEDFMATYGADLAVGPRPREWVGRTRRVGIQRFVMIVPAGDPRAGAGGADPADLADFAASDWVLYSPGHGLRDIVLDACAAAGFEPNVVVETRQVDAAARLAAAGLGVALVPHDSIPGDMQQAHQVELADAPVREIVAYARGEFVPPASSFVEMLATVDIRLDRPPPPPPPA